MSPALPAPSSSPDSTKTRPRRTSRFTEGVPFTLDLHQHMTGAPAANEHLQSMLHEMDDYDRKQRSCNSNSSAESLVASPCAGAASREMSGAAEDTVNTTLVDFAPEEGTRNINFGAAPSKEGERRSLDGRPGAVALEQTLNKFKGRLRALTGGRRGQELRPFPGT